MALPETLANETAFELQDVPKLILFHFEHPFHPDWFLFGCRDNIPNAFGFQAGQFSVDGSSPFAALWTVHGFSVSSRSHKIRSFGGCECMFTTGSGPEVVG